jgi:hypothetical protein
MLRKIRLSTRQSQLFQPGQKNQLINRSVNSDISFCYSLLRQPLELLRCQNQCDKVQ